jgi:ABC-type branched-subunit amino acid transport system ATPase component
MLDVHDVNKRFGGNVVLRKVSLTINPGDVVGLIGPTGLMCLKMAESF